MSRGTIRISPRALGLLFVCVLVLLAGAARPASTQSAAAPDPVIAAMIAQVQTNTLITDVNQLSGVSPATIGGVPYTFTTRETTSGEPIQKATQFAYEFLQTQGLTVRYQNWNKCGIANRNVIGEKLGTQNPSEIVLVTAHLDSIVEPEGPRAPGADDDASGSVGVMTVARILASYRFQRTLRFVFFTGEEQGLCGSLAYASASATAKEKIVAVYNLDMIAWDSDAAPLMRLHTRERSTAGYAADEAIARTFMEIVSTYGLGLSPLIAADGEMASDTFAFWEYGFPGVLAIEDDVDPDGDFNPYYHSVNDKVTVLNPTYFTNFVKASVGTTARLAGLDGSSSTPTVTPTPTSTATRTPAPALYLPLIICWADGKAA